MKTGGSHTLRSQSAYLVSHKSRGSIFFYPVVKIHGHLKHAVFVNKNRTLVSLRYSCREDHSLTVAMRVEMGYMSEPHCYSGSHGQGSPQVLSNSISGLPRPDSQYMQCRSSDKLFVRNPSSFLGVTAWNPAPVISVAKGILWLLSMCSVGIHFVFLPAEAPRSWGIFTFCRASSTQASSQQAQKCKLCKHD